MINLIRFIVRLLFTLILAIGLGLAVYYAAAYGVPALRMRYIQPVEENTQRLNDLEAQQRQTLEALTQQIESLHTRLTELEIQHDDSKTQLAQLESALAAAESTQATQAAALTDTQARLTDALNALEDLSSGLDALATKLESMETDGIGNRALLTEIQSELNILRLLEALTRGRLFISQGNYTQAEASIWAGLAAIDSISASAPDYQRTALTQVSELLQNALEQLAVSPLLAADQLDGAWQIIQSGLPAKPSPTPEAESTPEAEANPAPSPTATPES
jgi:predicted  nucleic acid-binding Zn-ribbon protein